jgi:hypothetical protein
MDIRKEFETQIESAEEITEETIQKIIEGRKEAVESSPGLDEDLKEKMLDEDRIREQNPIGDKSLFAIVYPSKQDYKQANGEPLNIQMTKVLESELEEFAENHKSLGAHPGHDVPRFQKNDDN